MVPDRATRRSSDGKIALAAEHIGGKRAAHGLERPFDLVPLGHFGELTPRLLGESAEVVLYLVLGQRFEPGAQGDLARNTALTQART